VQLGAGCGAATGVYSRRARPRLTKTGARRRERIVHGFHASESQCSYGLTMHLVSFALAGIILGIVLLIR